MLLRARYIKSQLIEEANKRILGEEEWENTGWEDEEGKVTIKDVLEYIGDNVVDIPVSYLQTQLRSQLDRVTKDEERIMKADLRYPIILVKKDGEFSYVIDGNHRLAKAILTGEENIKAKVLDMDNPDVPQAFTRLL